MFKNKKGVLLVELCISMAIVAIICTMTLTFTILLRQRTLLNRDRDVLLEDISSVETTIKQFLVHYDNYDYELALEDQNGTTVDASSIEEIMNPASRAYGKKLIAVNTNDSSKSRLRLENGQIIADWYDTANPNKQIKHQLTYVESISFFLSRPGDSASADVNNAGKRLIKCIVHYTDPKTHEEDYINLIFSTHAQSVIKRKGV